MAAPRRYPDEVRERAVRLVFEWRRERQRDDGGLTQVGEQLGVHPETLRNWVRQARIDDGDLAGLTSDERTRLKELERENRELRRSNEILKLASAFFAVV